jgi:aminopeptidase N
LKEFFVCRTDARKAFISFDEPDMKARFKIHVIHDASLNVVSNMPIQSSVILDADTNPSGYKWKRTSFHETVEMSTYLVAILVSDFQCAKAIAKPKLSKRVEVGVCARPNAYDQLEYALNASVGALEFLEEFYNIEYPLPKLDHIALPDFSSGAMENWVNI